MTTVLAYLAVGAALLQALVQFGFWGFLAVILVVSILGISHHAIPLLHWIF